MSQFPDSDPDPFPFNDRLRDLYGADEVPEPGAVPPPRIWAGVQPHLRVVAPVPVLHRHRPLLAGVGGLLLGVLLMLGLGWGPHRLAAPPAKKANPSGGRAVVRNGGAKVQDGGGGVRNGRARVRNARAVVQHDHAVAQYARAAAQGEALALVAAQLPAPGAPQQPQLPLLLLPLIQTETTFAGLGPDTARAVRETRRAVLLTQRATLAALSRRTDSLLLGLGVPSAAAGVALVAAPQPADSVAATPPALRNRWSVALSFAPERNFFGLAAPAGDSLSALRRTHEQGRAGYNAAVLAEYRVDHRLSVGAGLGMASYGAELRLTDQRTRISTRLDSSTVRSATVTTVVRDAYSIRTVPDSILAPILNANNQVIGYEYLPTTRRDTVRTHIENTQVDSLTRTTYTPFITTRQEVSARILRPNYRFLTVPVLVRYRLGRAHDWTGNPTAPRWWADVAVGAQFQFFLGGTQAATTDGRTYRTERVGPGGGPFRAFNVALTGAVAFNYALSPRLSASLAPTLRWQVESVYKPSTNLTQRPTATGLQLGLKYAF